MKHNNLQTALVTGSSGFIGRHLVKALMEKGYLVLPLQHEKLTDARQMELLIKVLNPNYIFHLAAYGNMANHESGYQVFDANLNNLLNLLNATKEVPYKAFVNVSTSSVTLPHQTLYSATKMGGEYLCKAFHDEYNLPIVSVRPFSIYGVGEAEHRFIPTVLRACLKGEAMKLAPLAVHDWLYVEDFVDGMILAAEKINKVRGKSIEFGWGFSTSNQNIVEMIEQITGHKAAISDIVKLRAFDTDSWSANTTLTEELLGWTAKTPDVVGLQKVYEQYRPKKKNH